MLRSLFGERMVSKGSKEIRNVFRRWERRRGMGKRDLAKRKGTHSCRSSNINSQTYLHIQIHSYTYKDRPMESKHTNMFLHMHVYAPPAKRALTDMNTQVCILTC